MTQCLLTLGAIPAISADTPHYPEETQNRRGGGSVVVVVAVGQTQCKGIFLPLSLSLFWSDDVSGNQADRRSNSTSPLPLHPGHDPSYARMATRARFGQARALARIGGATRRCKQRGVAQRHRSPSELEI